jgi:hypothetical protein
MKQILLVTIALLCVVSTTFAAPAPCVSGTLDTYIALGTTGCTVGSILFSGFHYGNKASGGAPLITANEIQVTPTFQVPEAGILNFSAKWQVSSGQSQDSYIRYSVSSTSVTSSSASLTLQLGTAQVGLIGEARVDEKTSVGDLSVYDQCIEVCRSQAADTLTFTPATAVLPVLNHLRVVSTTGTTSLSGFSAAVNLCPPCV